jgi:hypothetical protein
MNAADPHVKRLESDNEDLRAVLETLRAEVDAAQQFLDECYIGGTGAEPLVERIGRAVRMAYETGRVDVPKLGILDKGRIPQP